MEFRDYYLITEKAPVNLNPFTKYLKWDHIEKIMKTGRAYEKEYNEPVLISSAVVINPYTRKRRKLKIYIDFDNEPVDWAGKHRFVRGGSEVTLRWQMIKLHSLMSSVELNICIRDVLVHEFTHVFDRFIPFDIRNKTYSSKSRSEFNARLNVFMVKLREIVDKDLIELDSLAYYITGTENDMIDLIESIYPNNKYWWEKTKLINDGVYINELRRYIYDEYFAG